MTMVTETGKPTKFGRISGVIPLGLFFVLISLLPQVETGKVFILRFS
jgi:hypothetical protein